MSARLLVGDVNVRIREIPDGSIDLVCCSPPFRVLRKYGDDPAEMGSERTPAAFIDALLDLTGQFRRVLAPHGSIAIELGDTFSDRQRPGGPLPKSLEGIPEAFMLSLAYGYNVLDRRGPDSPAGRWRVRNVIVWARPNPPVGRLGDKVRPATSYITVACTSAKRWFDLDAVRHQPKREDNGNLGVLKQTNGSRGDDGQTFYTDSNPAGAPPLDWWEDDDPTGHATLPLPTQPYSGAHYATWPPTLAKRLIEMMCPLRVCLVCGEPSRRIVEAERIINGKVATDETPQYAATRVEQRSIAGKGHVATKADGTPKGATFGRSFTTLGWTDCGHNAWRNGHVLDPFAGSGTTLSVAHGCGRDVTGIELYEANADLISERLGMFLVREP